MSETQGLSKPFQDFSGSGPVFVTLYLKSTGEIVGNMSHSGTATCASATIGEADGQYDGSEYFFSLASNTIITRPVMLLDVGKLAISADGKDQCSIRGIPSGTVVLIDGGSMEVCTDGEIDFTATNKGTYVISFSLFPYLPTSVEVVAS